MLQRIAQGSIEPHAVGIGRGLIQRVSADVAIDGDAAGQQRGVPWNFPYRLGRRYSVGGGEPRSQGGERLLQKGIGRANLGAVPAAETKPQMPRLAGSQRQRGRLDLENRMRRRGRISARPGDACGIAKALEDEGSRLADEMCGRTE